MPVPFAPQSSRGSSPMRIMLVHNRYLVRGGEDAVVDQERDLLRSHGHDVSECYKDNRDVASMSKSRLAVSAVWSSQAYAELLRLMEEKKPDVVHVHNTLPLISPAVYYAAKRHGIPVVQTLHNYRLLCANGLLMRDSVPCEDCVGKSIPWPAVRHSCYRGDRGATLAVAASLVVHQAIGTFRREVGRYIALCQFARDKLLSAGLPEDRVVVKPNFTPDRHAECDLRGPRSGALFVGRLSVEKGVGVLLKAWESIDVELQVIGPGSNAMLLSSAPPSVRFRGTVAEAELDLAMRRAAFVVMPSLVYEGFPMVVAEAFSAGVPIIASRLGALAELVDDGVTGLHFSANDPVDLAAKVLWAVANPEKMQEMGGRARAMYLRRYTPEANYERLIEIYREASALVPAGRAAPMRFDES
jgi:glycosyltransferase involved in cell wall biosynthesis